MKKLLFPVLIIISSFGSLIAQTNTQFSIGDLEDVKSPLLIKSFSFYPKDSLEKYAGVVSEFRNLTELHIQSCGLKRFPNSFCRFDSLVRLTIIFDDLQEIPDCIENFGQLEYLNLTCNKITFIPDGIFNLTKLKELNLKCNKISKINSPKENLKNLISFDISDNKIDDWRFIEKMPNLQELFIGGSLNLNKIPKEIIQLRSLRLLNLGYNPNLKWDEVFLQIDSIKPGIEIIDLEHCGINKLNVEVLSKNIHLKELWLNGNRINKRQQKLIKKQLPNCNVIFKKSYNHYPVY